MRRWPPSRWRTCYAASSEHVDPRPRRRAPGRAGCSCRRCTRSRRGPRDRATYCTSQFHDDPVGTCGPGVLRRTLPRFAVEEQARGCRWQGGGPAGRQLDPVELAILQIGVYEFKERSKSLPRRHQRGVNSPALRRGGRPQVCERRLDRAGPGPAPRRLLRGSDRVGEGQWTWRHFGLIRTRTVERFLPVPRRRATTSAIGIGDDGRSWNRRRSRPGPSEIRWSRVCTSSAHLTRGHRLSRPAVNLCDIAAMGAEPRWMTLALVFPRGGRRWLEAFSGGLFTARRRHRVDAGRRRYESRAAVLSLQLHVTGYAPPGAAIRRDGAKPGDSIFVTGTAGRRRRWPCWSAAPDRRSASWSVASERFSVPRRACGMAGPGRPCHGGNRRVRRPVRRSRQAARRERGRAPDLPRPTAAVAGARREFRGR